MMMVVVVLEVEVLIMMIMMMMMMMMNNITGQLMTYNIAVDMFPFLLNQLKRNHDVTILWDM